MNTVGYLPDRVKRGAIVSTRSLTATTFDVKSVATDAVVFSGPLGEVYRNMDTSEDLRAVDFTAFTTPGEYYVEVEGVGKSAPFVIAADVYNKVYQALMMGMYGQRCGTAVSFTWDGDTFAHGPCHMNDGYLDHYGTGSTEQKPGLYGWHDAGDYNKYAVNGGFSVGMMLKAWELFSAGIQGVALDAVPADGALPKYLAEIKFQLEWMFAMQFEDGAVSHKLSALAFNGDELPESDRAKRYYVSPSSAGTADLVAVMAAASRVFRPYDEAYANRCLQAAKLSYSFLQANPGRIDPNQELFSTGGYTTHDTDDRLWAAAELWAATDDAEQRAALLTELESKLAETSVPRAWDWSNLEVMAVVTYALSTSAERTAATVEAVNGKITATANLLRTMANMDPYGRSITDYGWGSNGTTARTGIVLLTAHRLNQDDTYKDAAVQQLDHLLGRNYYSRSFVTGLGHAPPQKPHHRPSTADTVTNPWPGLLVGGSWNTGSGGAGPATKWVDQSGDYQTNEIAINWTTAMIFTAAGMLAAP